MYCGCQILPPQWGLSLFQTVYFFDIGHNQAFLSVTCIYLSFPCLWACPCLSYQNGPKMYLSIYPDSILSPCSVTSTEMSMISPLYSALSFLSLSHLNYKHIYVCMDVYGHSHCLPLLSSVICIWFFHAVTVQSQGSSYTCSLHLNWTRLIG